MKKSKSRSKLVHELDVIYSKYIRLKDCMESGMVKCVTCGVVKFWKANMQDGHFVKRSIYQLRWVDSNNHVQCFHCNMRLKGNYKSYTLFMQAKYGLEMVADYVRIEKENKPFKIYTYEIEEQIVKYSKIVVDLLKQHGLE